MITSADVAATPDSHDPAIRSGSTIRLAPTGRGSLYDDAMSFICRTDLVDDLRSRFGDALTDDGQRALLFSLGQERPEGQQRERVASALTLRSSRR